MASIEQPDEREELTRVMADLGGYGRADQLPDGAEELQPYYPEADAILEAGFHRTEPSRRAEDLIWEALEPYLEGPIRLDLNSRADNIAFGEMVEAVAEAVARLEPIDSSWEYGITYPARFDDGEDPGSATPLHSLEEAQATAGVATDTDHFLVRRRKCGPWERYEN